MITKRKIITQIYITMGKTTGFLEYKREVPGYESVTSRITHYKEFVKDFPIEKHIEQAARCMDCGIPFCHNACPVKNIIPDFNDAVYHGNWKLAYEVLASTNNFPEFTGRVCPAPCEAACVLEIDKHPTTIKNLEKLIIEKAFELGFVKPRPPKVRTEKRIAIIGSGPSGLAAAAQLNSAGHWVVVFERDDRPGGLLRYGIPDYKLDKSIIDRRLAIMREEGVAFKCNAEVGKNITIDFLRNDFDAIVLCGGSTVPRDLAIPGRELKGVHFAMEFLKQQNKINAGDAIDELKRISATGKNVVVIGGGDTGSDCIGTSVRHSAASITQLEVMPKPPHAENVDNAWPNWPNILRTSSAHEEGAQRHWSIATKEFISDGQGALKALKVVDLKWDAAGRSFVELAETEREIPCELALLAIGFVHPEHELPSQLGVGLTDRGNIDTVGFKTKVDNIFSAGDMRRGQSLVVSAICEGRNVARKVDEYLMGCSMLEINDNSLLNVNL